MPEVRNDPRSDQQRRARKSRGRKLAERASAISHHTVYARFPLTPALSLREREKLLPRPASPEITNHSCAETGIPSLREEGQGEGWRKFKPLTTSMLQRIIDFSLK